MNAIHWGLTAALCIKKKEALDRDKMIQFVMDCWNDEAKSQHYSSDTSVADE